MVLPGAVLLPGPAVLPVPGPPMVEPPVGLPLEESVLAVPEVEPLVLPLVPAVLPDPGAGVVEPGDGDDVTGGVSVASRLVQAPRDRAVATAIAAAAHWVRDVFIEALLVKDSGLWGMRTDGVAALT